MENANKSDDKIIKDSIQKIITVMVKYSKVMVMLSGGSDSDIVLDMIESTKNKLDIFPEIKYVFFNTGIESKATLNHLEFLENKYKITIQRERAKVPVPLGCKKYGLPFISKYASEMISRLQAHGFNWEDETFEILSQKYPNCQSALHWWCNDNGEGSTFSISHNRFLKEFMIANPPTFKISSKCCTGAKKNTSKMVEKKYDPELLVIGTRNAEGGIRAVRYKSCYDHHEESVDKFRPIQWYKDSTKELYENSNNIVHSDWYKVYGFKRSGCAACPFGLNFEEELKALEKYEPNLYKGVCNIFKESFEYTRAYKKFKEEQSKK